MLTPADIIAGKLVVQMGLVGAKDVREHMRGVAAEPETKIDLLGVLAWVKLIDRDQYQQLRKFVAMFEYIRHEAYFLRHLERMGLAQDEVYEAMAHAELVRYRRSLASILLEQTKLTPAQIEEIERRTLESQRGEDLRVLSRYHKQDYEGVARPLIPRPHVDETAFRIPILFRTEQTLEEVDLRRRDLEAHPTSLVTLDPDATQVNDAEDPDDEPGGDTSTSIDLQKIDRARLVGSGVDTAGFEDLVQVGPYEIIEPLGEGGMGAVYLAKERKTGTMVAVKVLHESEASEVDQARFEREARLLARFEHPNTISLIDSGRTEAGISYVVIPPIAGETLRAALQRNQDGLDIETSFDYFEQLLQALLAVHEAGVVHRDLKPRNIIILAGLGTLKLIDFGIARMVDEGSGDEYRTAKGAISGSPAYVAPESIIGGGVFPQTDIYSLGIVLFEMLTGKLPLTAPTPYGYLKEHLLSIPSTLNQAKPDVAWEPELEVLMARMLAKEIVDRPESCREILDALEGGLRASAIAYVHKPSGKKTTKLLNRLFKKLGYSE